jgi:hypothetical protein
MNPVAIVGSQSATCDLAPFDNLNIDIWGFNARAMSMKRVTASFEIHVWSLVLARGKDFIKWLFKKPFPTYMRKHYFDYPTLFDYPYDDIFKMTSHILQGREKLEPLKLLGSSVDHAIALAILQNRPKILMYGIELVGDRVFGNANEYKYQRDSFMFWSGFAAGRGIEMEIPCADNLFRKPIYGEVKL